MTEEEFNYFYKVGRNYDLKLNQTDSTVAKKEDLMDLDPTSNQARLRQLYGLIKTRFNNKISEKKDINYIKRLVITFGFSEKLADKLIEYHNQNPGKDSGWEKLILESFNLNL